MKSICRNPWCKSHFYYTENDMIIVGTDKLNGKIDDQIEKVPPTECPKCRSFNQELSGGVSWIEKKYEGSRDDGLPHTISINISKYIYGRKW